MLRKTIMAAASMATMIAVTSAVSAAETIRIETRPFYGATVTLEEGVRVFRPLPADRRVIINPGGRTPLSLNFEDVQSESHNYYYDYGRNTNADYSSGGFGGGAGLGHFGNQRARAPRRTSGGLFAGGRKARMGRRHGGRRGGGKH